MSAGTILLTGTRAPATLDLARRLRRDGFRVVGADSMQFPLGRFSGAFASHHRVPPPRFRPSDCIAALLGIARKEKATLLWPTCEEIFHLAAFHEEIATVVRPFFNSLEALEPLHDKLAFARIAGSMAPASWLAEEAPGEGRLVWKPRFSRFGVHTRFAHPPEDKSGWMAQEWVEGEEFSSWALCLDGETRTLTFYQCPVRAGRAGCSFAPHWDEEAAAFIAAFAEERNFTGSLAFDFIRGEETGLRVIECNPRLTSGIHVLGPEVSLAGLFARSSSLPPPMRPSLLRLPTLFSAPRKAWQSQDVVVTPDDLGPGWGQLAGFAELAFRSLRHGVSLAAASTLDIEYNGTPGPHDD